MLADIPWRKTLQLLAKRPRDNLVLGAGTRSTIDLAELERKIHEGRFFSFLDNLPFEEAQTRSLALLETMKRAEPAHLSPEMLALLGGLRSESSAFTYDFKFTTAEKYSSLFLLPAFFMKSVGPQLRTKFAGFVDLLHPLIWALMGPWVANTLNNPYALRSPPFGQFPWICCADGVLLVYLKLAREANPNNLLPQLPGQTYTVNALYSEATSDERRKLYMLASFLLDNYDELYTGLKTGLKHPMATHSQANDHQDFFFWNGEKCYAHRFMGPELNYPSESRKGLSVRGNAGPDVYYITPPSGEEEQTVANYAVAVQTAFQHPGFKVILYDILKVDQLVIPGQPWFHNPLANIIATSSTSSFSGMPHSYQSPPQSQHSSPSGSVPGTQPVQNTSYPHHSGLSVPPPSSLSKVTAAPAIRASSVPSGPIPTQPAWTPLSTSDLSSLHMPPPPPSGQIPTSSTQDSIQQPSSSLPPSSLPNIPEHTSTEPARTSAESRTSPMVTPPKRVDKGKGKAVEVSPEQETPRGSAKGSDEEEEDSRPASPSPNRQSSPQNNALPRPLSEAGSGRRYSLRSRPAQQHTTKRPRADTLNTSPTTKPRRSKRTKVVPASDEEDESNVHATEYPGWKQVGQNSEREESETPQFKPFVVNLEEVPLPADVPVPNWDEMSEWLETSDELRSTVINSFQDAFPEAAKPYMEAAWLKLLEFFECTVNQEGNTEKTWQGIVNTVNDVTDTLVEEMRLGENYHFKKSEASGSGNGGEEEDAM
ncbi:hypothetical protein BV20DRAFT_1058524 [Pilatotrama ljubarskyi]|nr:hypothetical protein BV20DRAFT_1058524 [Pilatotrama ljubarskyi]